MLYKAVQVLEAESHTFITTKKSLKEKNDSKSFHE